MGKLPKTITLELTPEQLMGYINAFGQASKLQTPRERRAASLDLWGDMLDDATPLAAILPPPFGVLVDDVLDIDGKLYDVVVAEAAKAWDAAKGAYDAWRAKKGERQAVRSTNRRRKKAKKTAKKAKKTETKPPAASKSKGTTGSKGHRMGPPKK